MAEKIYNISSIKSVRGDPDFLKGFIDGSIAEVKASSYEGATKIGDYMFNGNENLVSFEIPNTVKSIGSDSIRNIPITELIIPASVETIGERSIRDLYSLESFDVEGDISSIGVDSFININPNLLYREDEMYGYISTSKNPYYILAEVNSYNLDTTTPVIKKEVNFITSGFNYSSIESLDFEEGSQVKNIPSNFAVQCSNLKKITIPENVKNIGSSAFSYNSALEEIDYKTNFPIIGTGQGASVAYSINNLKKIKVHNLQALSESFYDNSNGGLLRFARDLYDAEDNLITHLNIPEGTRFIPSWGYYFNTNGNDTITEITIPTTLKVIGGILHDDGTVEVSYGNVFNNIRNLQKINFKASLGETNQFSEFLRNCGTNTDGIVFNITSDVKNIPYSFLENDPYIKEINISADVLRPESHFCYAVSALKKVVFASDSLSYITNDCFYNCPNITEIDVSNNKNFIGVDQFSFYQTTGATLKVPAKYYNDYTTHERWSAIASTFEIVGTGIPDISPQIFIPSNETYIEITTPVYGTWDGINYSITSSNENLRIVNMEASASTNTEPGSLRFRLAEGNSVADNYEAEIIISLTDGTNELCNTTFITHVINDNSSSTLISVSNAAGSVYGFELDEFGWYVNNNIGIDSSYAISQIDFIYNGTDNLYFDINQSSENGYDYGIMGSLDSNLRLQASASLNSSELARFNGKDGIFVYNYTDNYTITPGQHFIQIKYIKDGGGAAGTDTFKFRIRFDS